MATRNRRLPDSHFRRHEGVPGFIYIARNEFHEKDLYKVGYTQKESAQVRIGTLNQGLKKGGAGALGFLTLVYDRKTLNSYGAEKIVHRALKNYRVTDSREYFRAPLHDIMAAIDMAVKEADEARRDELDELQARAEAQAMQAENARKLDAARRASEAEADASRIQALERASHAQLEAQRQEEFSSALGAMLNTPAENKPVPPRPPAPIAMVNAPLRPDTLVPDSGRTGRYVTQGTTTAAGNIKSQTASNVAVGLLVVLLFVAYFINQPSQPVPTTSKPTLKAFNPPSPTPQTVEAVAAKALADYPYLGTSAGDAPSKLIVAERDKQIALGVPPPMALNQAVQLIAPRYAPKK